MNHLSLIISAESERERQTNSVPVNRADPGQMEMSSSLRALFLPVSHRPRFNQAKDERERKVEGATALWLHFLSKADFALGKCNRFIFFVFEWNVGNCGTTRAERLLN
jgi:hypothetical protein